MISLAALRPAVNAVVPHLPKAAGNLLTRSLPYLPLAFELAKVLYKHREKIGSVAGDCATQTANGVMYIARVTHHLPKRVGSKVKGYIQYVPLSLEVAKESLSNKNKVCIVTRQFPIEVRQKIERTLKRHQWKCCSRIFRKANKMPVHKMYDNYDIT